MAFLQIILFPIIFVMEMIIKAGHAVTASYGTAIIILSIIVYAAITPLRKIARNIQDNETALQNLMAPQLAEAKANYKGEAQFDEIERIYNEFNYHPIKSMRTALGLAIQIPFLLAALILLIDHPSMDGESFLFIRNLGAPDQLIQLPGEGAFSVTYINLLPILMLAITASESFLTSNATFGAKIKSNIIGVVIFIIVYPLASAIVLYWTCNNIWSLFTALARQRKLSKTRTGIEEVHTSPRDSS